jgi:arylsulfatase A-like enzyme/tetratricopeptide (TPR) repeat protein
MFTKRAAATLAAATILILAFSLAISRHRSGEGRPPQRHSSPDIILVTIDTLRWDALGYAGNQRVKTPFLDRLAAQGLVFSNAHAHNVVTLPSHANILTGLYPYQHGVRDNGGFTLAPESPTVAELLKQRGYATGAFVGAFPLDQRFGLNRGFDVYDDRYGEGSDPLKFVIAERPAEEVWKAAAAWYDGIHDQKRFLWVHLYDPHAPYQPPSPFAEQYASAPYLGEVAAVDAALAKYLQPILDRREDVLLILTSDHGEALGEHGELTHGLFAYESTLKIPLIVHEPGRVQPGRDSRSVRHIDIVPTVLQRVGRSKTPAMQGESLLEAGPSRDSYFEALSAMLNRGWAPLVGLIHQGHKYIDLPLAELYDLTADPSEQRNLVDQNRRVTFQIRKLLAEKAPEPAKISRNLSDEESAKLLSLGYISGNAAPKSYTSADDPKNLVDIDSMMLQVVHLYQLGQVERSVELARQVVKRRPDMTVGREMLAFVLQQTERVDAAVATLEAAVKNGTASASTSRRLGLMLSETGRAGRAVEILAPLAAKEDVEILNAYGVALADLGKGAEAIRQFERVLTVDPTNATAYQNLGIVALRRGDVLGATDYLAKALELSPKLPQALTTLGVIQARQGQVQAAISSWNKAIVADSRQYDAMFNLGVVAGRAGRLEEARGALQQFIRSAPPTRYGRELDTARKLLAQIDYGNRSRDRAVQ